MSKEKYPIPIRFLERKEIVLILALYLKVITVYVIKNRTQNLTEILLKHCQLERNRNLK